MDHDLRAENDKLRRMLQAECEITKSLRQELERMSHEVASAHPRKQHRRTHQTSDQLIISPSRPPSSDAEESIFDKSTYVVKHMGRLVHDGTGADKFAGSTTGVHFILRVEEACLHSLIPTYHFPESCFRLHLLPAADPDTSSSESVNYRKLSLDCHELRRHFMFPANYYLHQVDMFLERWESFCPVLIRREIAIDTETLLNLLSTLTADTGQVDPSTIMQLAMILSINQLDDCKDCVKSGYNSQSFLDLARASLDVVAVRGDLKALQALILCALHSQITGQSLFSLRLNGIMVRMAQSLGLHRHDRRFKFEAARVEVRRRIWWWIYAFDK